MKQRRGKVELGEAIQACIYRFGLYHAMIHFSREGHKPNKGVEGLVSLAICLQGASVPLNRLSLSSEQRFDSYISAEGCSHLSGCRVSTDQLIQRKPWLENMANHHATKCFLIAYVLEGKPQTKRLRMFPSVCRVEFQLAPI